MGPTRPLITASLCASLLLAASAALPKEVENRDYFSSGPVPHIQIEIPEEGMKTLRRYNQVIRQPRPERIDVSATVREGTQVYTNVAVHLKGSWSFRPIDSKPSLTLNFDKMAKGQRFHGMTKIHLNNSLQDPTYLSEQLGRELFAAVKVPSPRAGHALVKLNNKDLGLFVLIEGANKTFVKSRFTAFKGNLYDGGSGGDITKLLKVDSGEDPDNRSDLTNLVAAVREPDTSRRLARLEAVLDVEEFINFAAAEDLIVHWDGYAIGGNNYRVFHDTSRDKLIFMPSGMDQLFGVSSSPTLSLTPVFKGIVAKALFAIPEARRRYMDRITQLSTNEFRAEALLARVDKLAVRVRHAVASDSSVLDDLEQSIASLKSRIQRRCASVAQQLRNRKPPLPFNGDTPQELAGWSFKPGPTQPALSSRAAGETGELLAVLGRGPNSTGAWRTTVLLDRGHYRFAGRARTHGLTEAELANTNGVLLRISGERSTQGIAISDDWQNLTYEFEVRGIEDVELICEFRGPAQASGFFDPRSLTLTMSSE